MKDRVTVVVVTWNARKLLDTLVPTLRDLVSRFNVIVSDNASHDGTPEKLKAEIPEALILSNPENGGFGYGNNKALEHCQSEFVLLLNSDARIQADSVAEMVSVMDNECDGSVAGLQPMVRLMNWPMITLSAGCAMTEYGCGYDMDFMHFQPLPDSCRREVPCVTAALSLFRTDWMRRVGGFDERMFMYFEDIDLCLRMRAEGGRFLLVPDIEGFHMMGASSSRSRAASWELESSAYLTRRYLGGEDCLLPRYWMHREWRSRISEMIHGNSPIWRIRAVRRAMKLQTWHVHLQDEFLSWLLAARPLRMPNPRPSVVTGVDDVFGAMAPGPGWNGRRTGKCGFGCMEMPAHGGRLLLKLGSCNIPGTAAIWNDDGVLGRQLLGTRGITELSADVTGRYGRIYLVPDNSEQILELERADYI